MSSILDEFPDETDAKEYLGSGAHIDALSRVTKNASSIQQEMIDEEIEQGSIVKASFKEVELPEGEIQLQATLFNKKINGEHCEKAKLVIWRFSRIKPEIGRNYLCKVVRKISKPDKPLVFAVTPLKEAP